MKSKHGLLFLAVSILMGAPMAVYAEKPEMFMQVDLYSKGDGLEEYKDGIDETAGEAIDLGYDDVTASKNVSDGTGIRVGLLYPTKNDSLKIGMSLGYIKGPRGDFALAVYDTGTGDSATVTSEVETEYTRVLAELEKTFPFGQKWALTLKGGVGLAKGVLTQRYSEGLFAILGGSYAYADVSQETATGFTWEISPAIKVYGERADFFVGVTYGALPTIKEGDETLEAKWTPFGLKFGLNF